MAQQMNKQVIAALAECAAECDHCATACLEEQDVKMLARCIRLDLDCATICRTTAEFFARGSEHTQHVVQECIELCEACAAECEKHANKFEHCRRCAEACRKCIDACRNISGAGRAAR